jgi:hypothetical protein
MVNGQPIFLADYQEETARFEAAMAGQGFELESEEGKAMLAQMRRQVLDSMIEQVLIAQAATQEGVVIGPTDRYQVMGKIFAIAGFPDIESLWKKIIKGNPTDSS